MIHFLPIFLSHFYFPTISFPTFTYFTCLYKMRFSRPVCGPDSIKWWCKITELYPNPQACRKSLPEEVIGKSPITICEFLTPHSALVFTPPSWFCFILILWSWDHTSVSILPDFQDLFLFWLPSWLGSNSWACRSHGRNICRYLILFVGDLAAFAFCWLSSMWIPLLMCSSRYLQSDYVLSSSLYFGCLSPTMFNDRRVIESH